MTSQTTHQREIKPVTLEPAGLFLDSVRTQMGLGLVLLFFVCLINYWQSLHVGFLLDDFLHLDYVARGLKGDSHDLLANLYSNWGGSDLMKSYRPLISLSILSDYLLFGLNGIGYHVTNILLLFGCAVFVALITLELTGLFGNRMGAAPAVWAALLFAVYPLHAESVCWIIGRVDLLATLFYLISVFCLLRYRAIKELYLLWVALVSFVLSLISKEMAVTLPVVATLMLLFLPPSDRRQPDQKKAIIAVGALWFTLAGYALFRTALLGTAVGGYGGTDLHVVLNSWRNFLDKASMAKIFLPINEELHLNQTINKILTGSYIAVVALAFLRVLMCKMRKGPVLFLLAWTAVALLPTFQIWHIYPNLVGSRLFFLSSAPLCMLLAMLAVPSTDNAAGGRERIFALAGALNVVLLFLVWSYLLQNNLSPWITAGKRVAAMRTQLQSLFSSLSAHDRVMVLDLPTDYQGAGMITRPQYLNIMLRPPFMPADYSPLVLTIEPLGHGSHEFMWPGHFAQTTGNNLNSIYRYQPATGELLQWHPVSGSSSVTRNFGSKEASDYTVVPAQTVSTAADRWHALPKDKPGIEVFDDYIRIFPGRQTEKSGEGGLTLMLPCNLDPMQANVIDMDMTASNGKEIDCKVEWINDSADATKSADVLWREGGGCFAWLGRYRNWTLGPTVKSIGLRFPPGDYFIDLKSVTLKNDRSLEPSLERAQGKSGSLDTMFVNYSAPARPDFHAVKFYFTPLNATFDADTAAELATAYGARREIPGFIITTRNEKSGPVEIPPQLRAAPGHYQVQAVVLGKDDHPVGLPSEPVDLYIDSPGSKEK